MTFSDLDLSFEFLSEGFLGIGEGGVDPCVECLDRWRFPPLNLFVVFDFVDFLDIEVAFASFVDIAFLEMLLDLGYSEHWLGLDWV